MMSLFRPPRRGAAHLNFTVIGMGTKRDDAHLPVFGRNGDARNLGNDGKGNWFKGVQLLAVYAMLALLLYFVPT